MNQNGLITRRRLRLAAGIAALSPLLWSGTARAYEYEFNDGVTIQFDNSVQYTVVERTAPELAVFADSPNANDGDNNLRAGIVSSRFDLITKFDISDNGYGFDASADSFYDPIYFEDTQNKGSLTYNAAATASNNYSTATQTQVGKNFELRNLFIYGSNTIDGVPVTLRVGRFVNLFGESLFFAANGIAYGNAPVDVIRAVSVPNTQVKDLLLPTGQAEITLQPTDSTSVTAYYQFEWEKWNFMPAGSYFSTTDILDEGGQRIIAEPAGTPGLPPGTGAYFYRAGNLNGSGNGQFGLAFHYDPAAGNYDIGLYALQYNDTEPQVYVHIGAGAPKFIPGAPNALEIGTYQLVFPEHIQIYGASSTTSLGPVNVAGEVSVRANEPLNSSVTLLPGQSGNNTNDPAYAKGDTLHYQASEIYLGTASPFWEGDSLLTEVAGDNLLAITKNSDNFNRAYRHMAFGLRTVFTADYFHVLPGLDVSVPVGLGWNFMGLAPDTPGFNGTGIDRGGDLTIGLSGTYLNVWTGGISYTRYIAPPGRDGLADRDFAELNIERTF